MATAKRTTHKSGTTGRSPASAKRTAVRNPSKPAGSFIIRMYRNPIGKVFLIIASVLIVVGLDFLITLNHFDLFFIVLGIEWIIATLLGWIYYVFRDRLKNGS